MVFEGVLERWLYRILVCRLCLWKPESGKIEMLDMSERRGKRAKIRTEATVLDSARLGTLLTPT